MSGDVEIVVFDSFEAARPAWERVEKQGDGYAFQSYAWLSAWYETAARQSDLELCIVLVERADGTPLMLLPFGIERRAGVRCLIWLGGVLTDYQAPVLGPTFAADIGANGFSDLWAAVRRALPPHDAVVFEKQPECIGLQGNPFRALGGEPHASSAHLVHLEGGFEHFLRKTRSSKTRETERRKRRKLEKLGALSFVVARDLDDWNDLLRAMFRQKSENYRALGVTDLFAQNALRDFIECTSKRHIRDGFAHLCGLTLDNRIIATHWGLVYKKRLYYMFPSYERGELTRFSPGNILLQHLLEWCFDNDVDICDFTVGDEPYKFQWRDTELQLFDFLRSDTIGGYRYVLPLRAGRRLKRQIKQSPTLLKALYTLRSGTARLARRCMGLGSE